MSTEIPFCILRTANNCDRIPGSTAAQSLQKMFFVSKIRLYPWLNRATIEIIQALPKTNSFDQSGLTALDDFKQTQPVQRHPIPFFIWDKCIEFFIYGFD
jgi:hypothetical protein